MDMVRWTAPGAGTCAIEMSRIATKNSGLDKWCFCCESATAQTSRRTDTGWPESLKNATAACPAIFPVLSASAMVHSASR